MFLDLIKHFLKSLRRFFKGLGRVDQSGEFGLCLLILRHKLSAKLLQQRRQIADFGREMGQFLTHLRCLSRSENFWHAQGGHRFGVGRGELLLQRLQLVRPGNWRLRQCSSECITLENGFLLHAALEQKVSITAIA